MTHSRNLGRFIWAGLLVLLAGCGSVTYHLAGHSHNHLSASQVMHVGGNILALDTMTRLPAPGGFQLGLASEDPSIVSVELIDLKGGASTCRLRAHRPGVVMVHYINRYANPPKESAAVDRPALQAAALGTFTVTVLP